MSAYGDARDKIALEAMTALLRQQRNPPLTVDKLAEIAYSMADAMLAARETQEGSNG